MVDAPSSAGTAPSKNNDWWRAEYQAKLTTAEAALADIPESAWVEVAGPAPILRAALASKRPAEKAAQAGTAIASLSPLRYKHLRDGRPGATQMDVAIIAVSQPDENGYCSFGAALVGTKENASMAKTVIAEVMATPRMSVRTFGENFIHVTEIDRFVENLETESEEDISFFKWREPDETAKTIARYVKDLVRDGDTIEIGQGGVSEALIGLGVFSERSDLGLHLEQMAVGMIDLIRAGNVTGKRKTINTGKHVFSSISNEPPENLRYVSMNPNFEQRQRPYCMSPIVCAQHDNFVAINGALSIDLLGQITSETAGPRVVGIAGGLPGFVIGATMSKGGRSIAILPSTAGEGKVSRIVSRFPEGTWVTLPYTLADIVVSEFGVAELLGKGFRDRAAALIEIAHPDFRDSLRAEASTLPWAH